MRRDIKILCPEFLEFVRSKECMVAHRHIGSTEGHHLVARGWREAKRNDLTAINLCRAAHSEIEQIGVEKFEAKYSVSVWKENAWLMIEFFSDPNQGAVISIGKTQVERV
jgi:hypothetical protein